MAATDGLSSTSALLSSSTGSFSASARPFPFPCSLNVTNFVTVKLSDVNYLLWETQMSSLLESQEVYGFVTGEIPLPDRLIEAPNGTLVLNQDFESWIRTDRLIKAWITGTLDDSVLGLAVGVKSSAELWKILSDAFAQASEAREFELLSKLHFLKKTDSMSLSIFLIEFDKLCDQLGSIGKPILDQRKVYLLLTNLGPGYEDFATAMLKPPVPSYNELIPLLQSHELRNSGFSPSTVGGDGLSRYHTDFHEIEQIGNGHFSRVFKALKKIDGCMYAVKHSIKQLHQDIERRQALMEVQALAALGFHENIVRYYNSWFENEQLYIQMELCDHSLSIHESSRFVTEEDFLVPMHQIAKALKFIHEQGMAHLDVKPDNIFVKNGVYKLGDFNCATVIDARLPVVEGDVRYMPPEILNVKYEYEHLDKVDIFSLGATFYELVRGSPLLRSGPEFLSLREGKIPLLPGHSIQFQNLLKVLWISDQGKHLPTAHLFYDFPSPLVMMDPDPVRRPSAKGLAENPIFDKACRMARDK